MIYRTNVYNKTKINPVKVIKLDALVKVRHEASRDLDEGYSKVLCFIAREPFTIAD